MKLTWFYNVFGSYEYWDIDSLQSICRIKHITEIDMK